MKLFSLIMLVACLALAGCQKSEDTSSSSGSNAPPSGATTNK